MYTPLLNKYRYLVNAELMIQLTNAMYAMADKAPVYDEFRDMMSSGQLISKFWLVDELSNLVIQSSMELSTVLTVGGWYGTLSYFLTEQFDRLTAHSMDVDVRCADFIQSAFQTNNRIKPIVADMYEFPYDASRFGLVINTACEHISDVRQWLDKLPNGQLVVLQANDNDSIDDHINCPSSLEEFKQSAQLNTILYAGELSFPMYARYMIIGTT
jgi:hypothetical protein